MLAHWHVPSEELSIIAECHCSYPQKCLMAMLSVWWLHQTNPAPSWPDIADAVEFIGRPDIAQVMRVINSLKIWYM